MRSKNTLVESCSIMSVDKLQITIKAQIKKEFVDPSDEEVYNLMKTNLENFEINNQKFTYEAVPNRYGGHRWFFKCPKCSARSRKLFLPPLGSTVESRYLCKKCHGLKNRSAVMYNNSLYKNVFRPVKRMQEIEARIEKGWLNKEQTKELLDEYEKLEKTMVNCPEYRLYKFKKSRGISV